jgi:ABC-type nickel/cobalt efflux system permease component RcnA
VAPCESSAHPAGLTSINRYIGIKCDARGTLHIDYLLDFAELPSYAEFELLDADHDGTVTPEEQRAYLDHKVPPLLDGWIIRVNGRLASARLTGANLDIRDGEQGMSILRIAADVVADPSGSNDSARSKAPEPADVDEFRVSLRDPAFADRSGWREIAADDSGETRVTSGYREPSSDALAYARATAAGPPRMEQADFIFRRAEARPVTTPGRSMPPAPVDEQLARLSRAMKLASGSWSFSLVAIALAALFGAGHALSPGHGKALAATYLVGRDARPLQAVVFGISVTMAHTAMVFAFGLFALGIEQMAGTERFMRGLELAAAVAVTLLGLFQLSARWRDATGRGLSGHDSAHGHHHEPIAEGRRGIAGLVALGASSGLVPCPAAIAILLGAVALHRYAFGLLLVFVFSIGVASTLTAVGLLVLLSRGVFLRIPGTAPLVRWLPVVSSACVTAVGVLLCASAWTASP